MLTDEQMNVTVDGLNCRDVIVLLQCVNRLTKTGVLRDNELSVVGDTRDHLTIALEKAVGVNFDQARAAQEAELRHQQDQAQENDTSKNVQPSQTNN